MNDKAIGEYTNNVVAQVIGQAMPRAASDAQRELIRKMIVERGGDYEVPADFPHAHVNDMINALKRVPVIRASNPFAVSEQGMYLMDGTVYKVVRSGAGKLYAKRLDGTAWVYESGAIRSLTPEHKMTLEQAQEYGVATGVCCRCGRELTNPESIARGIGPYCAEQF